MAYSGTLSGGPIAARPIAGTSAAAAIISGSSTLTFSPVGILKGSGSLVGPTTLTLSPTAILRATGALAGATTLTFAPTATGALPGAGSAALTFTLTATSTYTIVAVRYGDCIVLLPETRASVIPYHNRAIIVALENMRNVVTSPEPSEARPILRRAA